MSDLFALLVMLACAVSIGSAVLLGEYLLSRRKSGDDPFGNAAYGDWPFVPTENFESFHSACVTEGGQPNNGAR